MNYELLGNRLKQERLKMNLTQEKLAEKVEVSHAYIGQIERGERSLTLDTLVTVSKLLRCNCGLSVIRCTGEKRALLH